MVQKNWIRTVYIYIYIDITLSETKVAPENWWLEDEPGWAIFTSYVSFRECKHID